MNSAFPAGFLRGLAVGCSITVLGAYVWWSHQRAQPIAEPVSGAVTLAPGSKSFVGAVQVADGELRPGAARPPATAAAPDENGGNSTFMPVLSLDGKISRVLSGEQLEAMRKIAENLPESSPPQEDEQKDLSQEPETLKASPSELHYPWGLGFLGRLQLPISHQYMMSGSKSGPVVTMKPLIAPFMSLVAPPNSRRSFMPGSKSITVFGAHPSSDVLVDFLNEPPLASDGLFEAISASQAKTLMPDSGAEPGSLDKLLNSPSKPVPKLRTLKPKITPAVTPAQAPRLPSENAEMKEP